MDNTINNKTLDNILLHILLPMLDLNSLNSISALNKRFNKLFNHNALWKNLIQIEFGTTYSAETVKYIEDTYRVESSMDLYRIIRDMHTCNNFGFGSAEELIDCTTLTLTNPDPYWCNALLSYTVYLEEVTIDFGNGQVNVEPAEIPSGILFV